MQGRKQGKYPFAKVADITRAARFHNGELGSAENYINDDDLAFLRAQVIPAGSVVFAKIGEAIRNNFRAMTVKPLLADNNVMSVQPDTSVLDVRYLYHFLLKLDLYPLANATSVPAIRKSSLASIQMPLPEIAEQKRISGMLDQAIAMIARRRQSIELLYDLAKSIFCDMFGHSVSNNLGWNDSQTLGEVASIVSGITKGRKAEGPFERVPYLAVANVQDMRLDLSVVKEIDASAAEILKYRLKCNDLLLTEGGDPDKLGRGTLWQEELPLAIHQNHIFRVRLREDAAIHPIFLNWLVSSERGRRYFLRSAKQTTGIASINATQLKMFPLLVPPLDLQYIFAERLAKLETQKVLQRTQLAAFGSLFASFQHRAFCGDL